MIKTNELPFIKTSVYKKDKPLFVIPAWPVRKIISNGTCRESFFAFSPFGKGGFRGIF